MSLEKQLQKSIDALKSDENVVKYLSDVQYEKTGILIMSICITTL